MARFRGSICSVGLSPVLSGNTPCSFRSRISKLEVLLSKTEQVGPSAPWDMPKWTLFRRPATAVHKSNLRSFPQRHIAWMSNITNTFRRVDRNSIGNPNIIPRNALLSQYENLHCGYCVASHPFHWNAIGTQSAI